MLEQYLRQAMFLLEEGASPAQVDQALERFGMAMGPFRMSDLAGNDVGWYIRKRRYVEKPTVPTRGSPIACASSAVSARRQASAGIATKADAAMRIPDPAVDALDRRVSPGASASCRARSPTTRSSSAAFSRSSTKARASLDERIALRASDIDVVYLAGYGFPRYRGGPMFYADTVGLYNVVRRMRRFAANAHADPGSGNRRRCSPRLAAEGKTFNT